MFSKTPYIAGILVLTAVFAFGQEQKQISLGHGFVLNTKMPVNFSNKSLNELFPIQTREVRAFKPLYESATQQAPAENQVRTICGEWVTKDDRVILLFQGRDWYIQKGSACAEEYYKNWQEQQDLSFIDAARKRQTCEQNMKKFPADIEMPVCPVCGKPIDARCGAVATSKDEHGHKVYMHADCRNKARFDSNSAKLRQWLAVNPLENPNAPVPPQTSLAQLSQQAKANALAVLKDIKQPSVQTVNHPAAPVFENVTRAEMEAFVAQNAKALREAGIKKREGKALTAQETQLLARFDGMRNSYSAYSASQQQAAERQKAASARPETKPVQPAQIAQVPVQKEKPVLQNKQTPANKKQGPFYIVTRRDIKRYERLHAKDMPFIKALVKSGASTDNKQLEALARTYKKLVDSYQYSQTPEGKEALKRVEQFEKKHADKIALIRQWLAYDGASAPDGLKPLIKEYSVILKEGNLHF